MCPSEPIRDKALRIVSHAAGTGFVQARSGDIDVAGAEVFCPAGAQQFFASMLAVLPHEQCVPVPLKADARRWDAVNIFYFGINGDVVGVAALGRRLNVKANGCGMAALDLTFELFTEA